MISTPGTRVIRVETVCAGLLRQEFTHPRLQRRHGQVGGANLLRDAASLLVLHACLTNVVRVIWSCPHRRDPRGLRKSGAVPSGVVGAVAGAVSVAAVAAFSEEREDDF